MKIGLRNILPVVISFFCSDVFACASEKLYDTTGHYIGCKVKIGENIVEYDAEGITIAGCEHFCPPDTSVSGNRNKNGFANVLGDLMYIRHVDTDIVSHERFMHEIEEENSIRIYHPFFGNMNLDDGHTKNFIADFDPVSQRLPVKTTPEEVSKIFQPSDPEIPFNAKQLLVAKDLFVPNAINLNADLGLQHTLREILRKEVLVSKDSKGSEHPNFIILSHGHPLAGLVELAKMTSSNNGTKEYLFDVSLYLPIGAWNENARRLGVINDHALIWGKFLQDTKVQFRKEGLKSAGGIAIGLNGHRGDMQYSSEQSNGKWGRATANFDTQTMLGKPKDFMLLLKKRGLKKVVIITEHYVENPNIINYLTMEDLHKSGESTFDYANRDLYEYMKTLKSLGAEIVVVSGEQRVERSTHSKK